MLNKHIEPCFYSSVGTAGLRDVNLLLLVLCYDGMVLPDGVLMEIQ